MRYYYIYGMNIASEIELPEAYEIPKTEDIAVEIVIGQLPEEVLTMYADKGEDEFFVTFRIGEMVFRIANTADYWVRENQIVVRPHEGVKASEVRCFIFGSCFGYLMALRKRVLLHGGGVSYKDKGIIVTGESGAGKSTVSTALHKKGALFIADDVCAIDMVEGKAHIQMAYPQQKLCRDAALELGYCLEDLIYINESRDKFAVRLKDGYLKDGKDFAYLFELTFSEDEDLHAREVKGHEKLALVMRNIYRGDGAFAMWGVPPEYMKKCLEITSGIRVYQISRPEGKNSIEDIIAYIEACIE